MFENATKVVMLYVIAIAAVLIVLFSGVTKAADSLAKNTRLSGSAKAIL